VSPAALLPTSVVLEQRLWLALLTRKPSRLVSTYKLSLKEFITYCKVRAARSVLCLGSIVWVSGVPNIGMAMGTAGRIISTDNASDTSWQLVCGMDA
jgi:hypothetical protein